MNNPYLNKVNPRPEVKDALCDIVLHEHALISNTNLDSALIPGIDAENCGGFHFWLNGRGPIPTEAAALGQFLIEATPDTGEYYEYDRFLDGQQQLLTALCTLREQSPKKGGLLEALNRLASLVSEAEAEQWAKHFTDREAETPGSALGRV